MNDAILLQHCSENWEGINMLKVTAVRNLDYCMAHKFDIELSIHGETPVQGDWDKVRMIRALMDKPYKYIVYLDVDTVIADMKADLRDGCPEGKIGCCRHIIKPPEYSIYLDHFNTGAIYISNCDETKAFVDKWLAGYPGSPMPAWYEQGVMNNINDGTVVEIDAKWNATGNVNPSPNPAVLGFHGQGSIRKRFDLMIAEIKK